MRDNYPNLIFEAPYEYLSMKSSEMSKIIKNSLRGDTTITPSKIHEYLSFSQKNLMETLIEKNIVQVNKVLQEGGFVFNTSPGIKRTDEEKDFNLRFKPVFTDLMKSNNFQSLIS